MVTEDVYNIMKTGYKLQPRSGIMNEKGTSALEFALVLPVFLLIFFGIIEYGWVMTQKIVLSHAVAAGARAAIKMPDDTSDEDLAITARNAAMAAFNVVGTLDAEDITVNVVDDLEGPPPIPRRIFVYVTSREYTPLIDFLPDAAVPGRFGAKAVFAFP